MIGSFRLHQYPRVAVVAALGLWLAVSSGQSPVMGQAGIAFVQGNYATPQSAETSVVVTFTGVQTAGNLNVVAVGWNDTTAQVQTVTDTRGNTYVRAVGPTILSGLGTQSIYYASNIAAAGANSNAVTVTFAPAAQHADIRIAEYQGLTTVNPVDVVAAATGIGASSDSGTATTTNANDLLVGANLVAQQTTGPGTGYTNRMITTPDGDILEDRLVTSPGSYNATATLSGGGWIMQMVAFRGAGGASDGQAPTAPGGLTATAASSTQVNLAWTASTDNVGVTGYLVERCQGAGCAGFTQVATAATASYTDTTVVGSTSYSYRVRATDLATNLSGYSNTASATTPAAPDTQAPTAPGGLTATAAASTQVNLAWTAATDNVGVTGYLVERCQGAGCASFAQIGTATTPGYTDTTVVASTSYSYQVRARDAANNLSPYSNAASATTAPASAGIVLVQTAGRDAGTTTSSTLAFPASNTAGNWIAVAIRAGGSGQTFAVSDTRGNTYRRAIQFSETVDGTTLGLFYAESIAGGSNTVTISDSIAGNTLRIAILEYAGVAAANSLDVAVAAQGTSSTPSSGIATTTTAGDLVIGLISSANGATFGAGAGYVLEAQVPAAPNTKLAVEDRRQTSPGSVSAGATLSASNSWGAALAAFRPAAGVSDGQAPTAPAGLTATAASSAQVNLTWAASTDNVGVTGYLVERCQGASCESFAQIGTATTASYSDTTVVGNTGYSYRVRATDLVPNLSGYSNTATATTPPASAGIALVQYAGTDSGSTTSASLAFPAANIAGNWIAVVIRAGGSGQTFAVSDTRGNTYRRAVQFNETVDGTTLGIFYAENIAGGPNSITVSDSMTGTMRFGILEYSGVASTSSLDVTSAAQGTGTTPNSGPATTTSSGDLVIGLISSANGATFVAGSGYVLQGQVPAAPNTKLGIEDRRQAAPGSVSAGATLSASNNWGAALAAFRPAAGVSDTQAPTAPSGLTATAVSTTQVNLAWTASTDNVGVTGYLVERCQDAGCLNFAQIGTAPTASYTDNAVVASTSYSYRVRATDLATNLSAFSNIATAATGSGLDSQPPSAPGTLTAVVVSGTQLDLSWGPATDNVGVTGYRVERCQGAGCSIFVKLANPTSTTFSDTGLTPNTNYSYVVLATDGAGNLGPYSNTVSVTTAANVPELVASYSFNEGTGTTAIDTSGRGNNGSIGTATWTTAGKYGGALSFNGSAKVVVPDSASLHLTTGVTLEAWVKPSVVDSTWRDVVYKGDDIYYLEATTPALGRPATGVTTTSGHSNTYGTAALPVNTWTHLAQTFDGTTVRLYVNGVQVASTAQSGSLVSSTYPLEIGGDSIYAQYFEGLIDEVRVFNVARTPTQIQADMGTPVGSTVPIVSLSSASVDFGQGAIGVTTGANDVTLANVGGATLSIGSIAISGTSAGDFAQTNTCGSTLAAGSSCTIAVTFTPGATGSRNASLSVQDDAAGAPHAIALAGTGVAVLVTPGLATLTPGRTQQFTATSGGATSFIWLVDNVEGGSAASGTITASGLYSAPAGTGTHTVTATTPDQSKSGNATVYVVSYTGTFTYHNDNARTGANLNETVLTTGNVNAARFGKLQSFDTDGASYASPLYAPAVAVPGQGVHNIVYVATERNSVYAFDADGLSQAPLWHVSFINPSAGITTVSPSDVGECCDITPQIGITGTPVIDPASGTLYVVAKTKEIVGTSTNFVQRLHALDIATGAEKFGGPAVIQASVPGTGAGSSGGQVPFSPLRENQRPALLLNNGIVYIAFGSHGDQQPYHGWLLGYDAATLQQRFAYNATANGEGAGVWIAGSGPAADAAGNVFFVTGDGTFDANTGGTSFGDSYLKMSSLGAILDYFTPHNQSALDLSNADLGAGGIMLIPDQPGAHPHLMVSAGKNGTIDLIDRDNMGHYNPNNDNQIVQSLINIFPFGNPEPGNYSAPVYFKGTVYFSPVSDNVQAFTLTNGVFSTTPSSRSAEIFPYPGGTLSISANGNTNGILWALERRGTSPGALRAYDALNLGIELYNSDQAGSRDTLDEVTKFSAPLVANGKVYVGSTGKFTIFGLFQ